MRARFRVIAAFLCAALIGGCAASHSFITIKPEPKINAWWLRSEFHPFGSMIRGTPVKEIRRDWCKANEFSVDLFPPEVRFGENFFPLHEALKQSGAAFSVSGKFDGAHVFDVFVGVYETCSGERGTFLIAIENGGPSKGGRLFVEQLARPARFAVLHASDDSGFELWLCFACDDFAKLRWNKAAARFEVEPETGDEEKREPK